MTAGTARGRAALPETAGEPGRRVPLRRIVALFRPYRGQMTLLLFVVLALSAVSVIPPFFIQAIINDALPRKSMTLLTAYALGIVAAAGTGSALSVASQRLSSGIGQQIMHDIRLSVFSHLQRMSFAFFTNTRTGEIQSRIANDIGSIDNILVNTAAAAVQSVATTLAVVVALSILDWKLALVTLVAVPAYLAFTLGIGRTRRTIVKRRQERLSRLTSLIHESLSIAGVLLAKTMGRQAALREDFRKESLHISRLEVEVAMAGRWRLAARRTSLTVIPAIVYWLGGLLLTRSASAASIGTLVASASMLNRLASPASSLQGIGISVSSSLAIFGRIIEVLDLPVEIDEKPGALELAVRGEGGVSLRGVGFRYEPDGPWTLRDINLDIPAGTTTAIVGQTGSGKTTLAYLIARLYEPERGQVRIDGTDVREVTLGSLAATIGFISQETYLFHASIAENLRFARPEATSEDLERAARAARIHDTVMALPHGYHTVVGERGYRFSGGERQRLAIARLLLRNPPIVILDEATSALDNETERAVQETLREFAVGRTTVVIAHRLSTIRDADQIVVMNHGQIAERGSRDELLARGGRYASLAGAELVG
jgi:ATP-binding cassette subfamily B protein